MSLLYIAKIAIFAPLIGFLIAGFDSLVLRNVPSAQAFLRRHFAQGVTCFLMAVCCLCSCFLFYQVGLEGQEPFVLSLPWLEVGSLKVHWGIQLDALSVTMMMVVSLVSFLVHIYSIGYMAHDPSIARFMAYLSLFTFAMLVLVVAPNLIQLFFGWEGVGLVSYLLIGFWYEKPSANEAAMKAFIINRIGDMALVLGICAVFLVFQTVDYHSLFHGLSTCSDSSRLVFSYFGFQVDAINAIGVLLFIGSMGKSAQLGLHTWLPDAMEGPTPVSALIHAATMVTAGIFLIVRVSPLYDLAPIARDIIAIIGATTAFFAATVAVTQNDIKRIIAYSTCSQLGYMFFAIGVSAYGAAMFHLVTHAFFKALLFLGAGAVIHAMSDEQDIRRMGGIWLMIPVTYAVMWVGNLALAGIPFFAGYYSKDAILEAAYSQGTVIGHYSFVVGLVTVILTAFYSWRLLFLTFHGVPRADDRVMAHVHEPPQSMKIPLYVLALGAMVSGYLGHDLFLSRKFWGITGVAHSPEHLSIIPYWISSLPLLCSLVGIAMAYLFYERNPQIPNRLMRRWEKLYLFSLNKGFVDEFYERLFVRPALSWGRIFWKKGDGRIDRFGPNGVTAFSLKISKLMSSFQTGYVYHYAFAMLVGIVALVLWIFLIKGLS